jgi:hypothetical protein
MSMSTPQSVVNLYDLVNLFYSSIHDYMYDVICFQSAALNCLGAAFSSTPPSRDLAAFLAGEAYNFPGWPYRNLTSAKYIFLIMTHLSDDRFTPYTQ